MRLASFDLRPYRLRLSPPVPVGAFTMSERRGLLVGLRAGSGEVGWGECAPLPGFSRESLTEAHESIITLIESIGEYSLDPRLFADPAGPVHRALDAAEPAPSVRFALDLALWDLGSQALSKTLAEAMVDEPAVALPINGLLTGTRKEILKEGSRMAAAGYRALKLKVGRGDLLDEAALVRELRDAIGPGIEIRLDANRAWSEDEARRFADAVRPADIAYVEEPLRESDLAALPLLWMDTGLPIALDETVQIPQGEALIRGWVAAVILKPSLVGGVGRILDLAARAHEAGARPILSSAYESGVGLRGVIALAAAAGAEPAGLDTARRMADHTLATPLPLDRPFIDVGACLSPAVELADPFPG